MLEKIEQLEARYEVLMGKLMDPAVISDQRYMARWFEELQGWVQMQWLRRVISFAKSDQTSMYNFMLAMSQAVVAKLRDMAGDKYESLAQWSWKNLSAIFYPILLTFHWDNIFYMSHPATSLHSCIYNNTLHFHT